MLTLIIHHFYSYNISNYHHYLNIHPNQRHPHQHQQQHNNYQQIEIRSPWFRQTFFSPLCKEHEHFDEEKSLTNSTEPTPSVANSDAFFVNKCSSVFIIVLLLMVSSCDGRKFHTSYSVGLLDGSRRVARDAHDNNSSPAHTHFTHLMASTNTSTPSYTTPTVHIPNDQLLTNNSASPEKARLEGPLKTKDELISDLISTLEMLNLLRASDSSCFRLDRIIRKNIGDSSSSSSPSSTTVASGFTTFGVYLYFEEVQVPAGGKPALQNVGNDSVSQQNSGRNSRSIVDSSCISDPIVESEPWARTEYPASGEDGQGNATVVVVDEVETTGNGISRTHIVVISTCSAIIGMFFLAAAFLRIRNYIKRSRLEQEMANRPKFRSCSVALRGATQSMEQLRRDSLASKTSHQNSETTKGSNGSHTNGTSRENSSSSSPRHDPDTAPLLLLARGVQLADPATSTECATSMHCVEEEAPMSRKKMVSPTALTKIATNTGSVIGRGQGSSEKTGEAINPVNAGHKTPSNCTDIIKTRQIGQLPKTEGNVNPSFSSGSIAYNHLSSSDVEPPKRTSVPLNSANNAHRSQENTLRRIVQPCGIDLNSTNIFLKSGSHFDQESTSNMDTTGVQDHTVQHSNNDVPRNGVSPQEDRQGKAFLSLQTENSPNRLENSVSVDESSERNCCPNVDTEIVNSLDHSLEISYFGLSKSDISLSSVTNQGNEFFGQTEYHHPFGGIEPIITDALNSSKRSDIVDDWKANKTNKLNINTSISGGDEQHSQLTPSKHNFCSELENEDRDSEIISGSLNDIDRQTTVQHSLDAPSTGDLSVNNNCTTETLGEETLQKMTILPLKPGNGSISLTLDSIISPNHLPANLKNGASIKTRSDNDMSQSAEQSDNEISNEEMTSADKCRISETQNNLCVASHEAVSMLISDSCIPISCRKYQTATHFPDEYVLKPQNHVVSMDAPLPEHRHTETSRSLLGVLRESERKIDQHAADFSNNDHTILEANSRCHTNSTISLDSATSSANSNDICHQPLPLQTHSEVMNSSTY